MSVELLQGDCLQIMPNLPSNSVDMILCDLPYGTIDCAWDSVIDLPFLWGEYKRIIKQDGAIVLFGAQPFTTMLISSNFSMFKYCWVWSKSKAPDFVNAKNKPMRIHEDIAVFSLGTTANGSEKRMKYFPQGITPILSTRKAGDSKFGSIAGKRPSHKKEYLVEGTGYPTSILYYPNEGNTLHPTQKPIDLLRYLIRTYTNEGDTILDNCMGSGSTIVACIEEKRNAIGIELDPTYFQLASERINKELTKPRTMQMELV